MKEFQPRWPRFHPSSLILHLRFSLRKLRVFCASAVNRGARNHSSPSRLVAVVVALSCLVLSLIPSSAQNTNEPADPRAANLHQWGAVTLFHGLPSDRVRAIEQDAEGALWFGTDGGLARYDGRRTQTVPVEGLAQPRVNALKFDESGALWVGTEAGAAVLREGQQRALEETKGKAVTSIMSQGRGRAVMTTAAGQLFSCAINLDGTVSARAFPAEPLRSADADKPGALQLTSLAQGRNGLIYVGTRSRGLVVFDGERAREVLSRPRPYFVEAVDADGRGSLWLGARARGADGGLYAGSDLTSSGDGASLKHVGEVSTVSAVRRDAAGDVWAGTDGLGAFHFRDGQQIEHFTFENTAGGLRSNRVFTIFFDREGVVWFGTDRGVCRYDPDAPRTDTFGGTEAAANFVRAIFRTRRGELLAGTSRGLYVFDGRRGSWAAVTDLSRHTVYSIAEDSGGRLVVGTSSGLFTNVETRGRGRAPSRPETRGGKARAGGETGNAAGGGRRRSDARADDEQGDARRGGQKGDEQRTDGQGDESGAEEEKGEESRQKPSAGESVRAIRVFRDSTYVASYGRGVERVEGERRASIFPGAGGDARLREVTGLYAEGDARLWIGTARAGVFVFDGEGVRAVRSDGFERLRGAVWSFDGSPDRGLWIGAGDGLYFYRTGAALSNVVPGVDARAVVAEFKNDSRDGDGTKRQGGAGGPAGDDANAHPAAWCATAGAGLLRVRLDAQLGALVSRLDVEQGLASPHAYALLRADDSATKDAGSIPNGRAGGREDAGARAGTLFVGTTRGLVRYSPDALPPSLVAVRVLSRRLHAASELQSGIDLPYPQNSLALDVAAQSSRTFPEQFTYAFTLRDGAGREVRRKLGADAQFLMENLAPGSYTVEARAFTKDLVPSAPLRFAFTIGRAPFPRTTVLLASLLALALVALGWGAWQNREMARATSELADANRQLASARLNLANEAERERRRIARDLHDQTLADLRSLMLLTDQLPAHANGRRDGVEPAAFRSEIESISTEIRRICEDLSPSALDNVGLAAALEWALSNAAAHCPADERFEHGFTADEDLDERLSLAPGVRMQLYRVAQEAITNVCRHAAARRVSLSVHLSPAGTLTLTLEDDGRSDFDPHERRARRGRGLAGIRDRASLIDAEVIWERRDAGGTRFTLRKADAAKPVGAV
jgi:signal transduction histidine kinase/ligand-binding sensor domain-containing protein